MNKLEFIASLSGTNTAARWLSVSKDGDAKITLEAPASELANVIRLALFAGQSFKVTVERSE